MNLETFGRNLVDLLAERALDALRGATVDDVRRTLRGQLPASPAAEGAHVGTTLGAFAIGAAVGAAVAALYTPTSGDELRTKLARGVGDARVRAMALGETIRSATATTTNGHAPVRASRAKRASAPRAHHDA
jgi:hypothetical protein